MPFSKFNKNKNVSIPTIFVSIPSYRDNRCSNTLKDLYTKAQFPSRVHVGVLTQNNYHFTQERCYYNHHNIKYKHISYLQASGPLKARATIVKHLFDNQDYYLMIDAHSTFAKHWDTQLINQLTYLQNKGVMHPIFTNYTSDTHVLREGSDQVPFICKVIDTNQIPLRMACEAVNKNTFAKGYFIGAGFMFSQGQFIKDIHFKEFDVLEHIFNGEEILYAALAYTHGYDIYTPADNLVFHDYGNRGPSYFADRKDSKDHLHKIVHCLKGDGEPGMGFCRVGKKRTLDSYWKNIGFNIQDGTWNKDVSEGLCQADHGSITYIDEEGL